MAYANVELLFVGLDVGGTTMKAGVVDDAGRPLGAASLPTEAHRGQEAGLKRMCETILAAVKLVGASMEQISAIGVATPGLMDIPGGLILDPMNLKPWRNVPVLAWKKPFAYRLLFKTTPTPRLLVNAGRRHAARGVWCFSPSAPAWEAALSWRAARADLSSKANTATAPRWVTSRSK